CVVDDPRAASGRVTTWGTWSDPQDLMEPGRLLGRQAAAERAATNAAPDPAPDAGADEARGTDPELLLVCAHGRHDVCCATRGRPVAAALQERWPQATWECSHTGGDRFAANLIVLPDGACYGGLDPSTACEVVQRHHDGAPDTAYLRGHTGWSRPAQAALLAAHREMPTVAWGAFVLEGVQSTGTQHLVDLSSGATRLTVPVTEHVRTAERITCATTALGRVMVPVPGQVRVRS
ncbi:MAG: sucrase ferredoxin, partial [Ornithinimicrobium sp.]